MRIEFDDGVSVDTGGALRAARLEDGWYVLGRGLLIPCDDARDAAAVVRELSRKEN